MSSNTPLNHAMEAVHRHRPNNPPGTVIVGAEPSRGFQWDDAGLGSGVVAVSASMLAAGAIRIRVRRAAKSMGL